MYVHFFCSECYMHFAGVLSTSAWAGVYVIQVSFNTNIHICEHTRCRLCTYVYMVYACICIWMRMCVYDIAWHVQALLLGLSVHTCAYACVCICVCMYECIVHVYMYVYVYMYVCVYVCIYIIYVRVWLYICTRVGAFCLFVLSNLSSNLSTTCACITGVS